MEGWSAVVVQKWACLKKMYFLPGTLTDGGNFIYCSRIRGECSMMAGFTFESTFELYLNEISLSDVLLTVI